MKSGSKSQCLLANNPSCNEGELLILDVGRGKAPHSLVCVEGNVRTDPFLRLIDRSWLGDKLRASGWSVAPELVFFSVMMGVT